MPGSTSSPSESSKAKVTSATNGVFVRPVAVAGIFCPTNDDSNSSPPALPEKKRFSAVAGDLRSCSTNDKSEDFSKRRQSWDVQQKEILFGQALLRKTPRRIDAPAPRTVKSNSVGNGTVPEISSFPSDDKNSLLSPVNKLPDSSKISEPVSKPPNNGSCEIDANNSSVRNKDTVNGLKEKSNNLSSSKQVSKELSFIKSEIKKETQLTTSDLPTENNSHQGKKVLENKSSASSEIVKQTKRVYGLIKRESKSEVSPIPNDCGTSAANTSVDAKNATKPKVYGLNKQNTKKDVEINKSENELSVEKRNLQTSSVESSLKVEKKDLKSSSVESSLKVEKKDLKVLV
ncbi:unconventional myosin-XVIIIa [Caerostris extrusa]|uniref:Unconventional myosin-XVIIIa n=1 Tax=Caerostris extrusa TaxID=172846 RepID=A0AAV4Y977_CAEEX|nr:unconventional myosin-XVIIIa [Caerostris extrusa]